MTSKLRYYLFLFSVLSIAACTNAPDFPLEPQIEFVGMSKSSMVQNSLNTDSIFISISFTDGDGDLGGVSPMSFNQNLFVIDNRTGENYDQFRIPEIPPEGATNGISGEIILRLFTTCCLFPEEALAQPCDAPLDFPTNELTLDIYIMDRAGNRSNTVTTDPIVLLCD